MDQSIKPPKDGDGVDVNANVLLVIQVLFPFYLIMIFNLTS